MKAHAKLPEPERADRLFAAVDGFHVLNRHGSSVGDSRTQACGSRPIPGREAGSFRELADFAFRQAGVYERRFRVVKPCRLLSGAIVAQIVAVHAIDDVGDSAIPRELIEAREQLVLAVKTPVAIILQVLGIFELAGFYVFVADSVIARKNFRISLMRLGKRSRIRRDRDGPIPESFVRRPCE